MKDYIPGNMVANSWFPIFIRNKTLTFFTHQSLAEGSQKRVVDGLVNVHDGRGAEISSGYQRNDM